MGAKHRFQPVQLFGRDSEVGGEVRRHALAPQVAGAGGDALFDVGGNFRGVPVWQDRSYRLVYVLMHEELSVCWWCCGYVAKLLFGLGSVIIMARNPT